MKNTDDYKVIKPHHQKSLELFLKSLQQHNRSAHTELNYESDLKKFLIWLENSADKTLKKVKGQEIGQYLDFLAKGGIVTERQNLSEKIQKFFFRILRIVCPAPKVRLTQAPLGVGSRKRHLSSINNFFEFLRQYHSDDWFNPFRTNPVRSKIHQIALKEKDVIHTKYIEPYQFEVLLESTQKRDLKLALCLLYYGGLRLHELAALTLEALHPPSQTLTFERKGGKRHQLRLQSFAKIEQYWEIYLFWRQRQKKWAIQKSLYVFPSTDPKKPLTVRAWAARLERLIDKAGLPKEITPHSLRKACATELYLKTKDLLFVRDYLNHSDAKVTQTYIDTQALWENYSPLEESQVSSEKSSIPTETLWS